MPFKPDDSGRRWVEMEFLVAGTSAVSREVMLRSEQPKWASWLRGLREGEAVTT